MENTNKNANTEVANQETEKQKLKDKERELIKKRILVVDRISELKKELEPLNKELMSLGEYIRQSHKELILSNSGFTEEQVDEIANGLTKSKKVYVYYNNELGENAEFEDDGFIHITRNGIRFVKEGHNSELQSFANNIDKQLNKENLN